MKLSTSDYKKILKFYKLSVPKKSKNIKKKADKIIAKKFCSCIKKVQQKFKKEGIAIGICTKSVITRKGYKRGKFRCKKQRTVKLQKGGKRRKKKTRKKRGKGATISRFFIEPDYTWNVEQFDGDYYDFGAAEEALESYMNEYGSPPHTREYQLYRLQEQRRIIDDFHDSIDRSGWQGHLDRARQAMFQQMGNEPQLPQARTEADFRHLIQNSYSGNQSPGAAGGGKRKKKTRRKKGGDEKFKELWQKCMNNFKLKKLEEQYITRNIKAQDFIDSRLMLTFSEILREMEIVPPENIKELEEKYKNVVTKQATERGSAASAISLVIARFIEEMKKKPHGGRRKKTRKKRGGVKTPRTGEIQPKNDHQPMPVLTLPPSAISSLNAEAGPETIEEIFRDNMRQQLVGIDDPSAILQILSTYQIDYISRIGDGLVQNGDFGERLNQDVTYFQNYIGSL